MKWLKRLFVVLLALLLVAAGLGWFVLGTERGARFTFARIVALTEGRLTIGEIRGTLPAPLTLINVRYRDPAAGVDVAIERLVVDVGATAALSRRALIESLDAEGVAVRLTTVPDAGPETSPWEPPLDFVVDRAELARIVITRDGEPLPRLDRVSLAGDWTRAGIDVRRFVAAGPDGRIELAGRAASARGHRGNARGSFTWRRDGVVWVGAVAAASDGRNAQATLELSAPLAANAILGAVPSDDALPWTLVLTAPAFDPAVLVAACTGEGCAPVPFESVAVKLEGRGTRARFALTGELALDAQRLRLERLEGALADERLVLDALRATSPDFAGALEAKGTIELAPEPPQAKLELAWQDVVLPEALAGRVVETRGTLAFEGSSERYAANGRFAFGPPGRVADAEVALSGDARQVVVETLKLVQAKGGLDARGTVTLEPALGWQLEATAQRFDPGAFLADWPGSLDFTLATRGSRGEQGVDATIALEALSGTLRNRPVAGKADLTVRPGNVIDGTAELRSGASRVTLVGRGGAETDVTARLDVATLADFLPDAMGRIEGEVRARGTWPALDVDADLEASDLFHAGGRVRALELDARLENLESPSGRLTISAQDIERGALSYDTLTLELAGSEAQHRVVLDAAGEAASLSLAFVGARDGDDWRSTVETFELGLRDAPKLVLEAPASVARVGGAISLPRSCFGIRGEPAEPGSRICLASEASNGAVGASYSVERLPIALAVALADPGAPLRTEGVVDGSGRFARTADGAWSGTATLASASGLVAYPDTAEEPLLRYTALTLDAEATPGGWRATARATFDEGGSLDSELRFADDALSGRVDLAVRSLRFIELLTPEIANPVGAIEARYTIGGTRDAPRLDGALTLSDFGAEVPASGLVLRDGRATLRAAADDRYTLDGSVRSGEGTLTLAGEGGIDASAPLEIAIRGENVLAFDIPGVKVVAAPDLEISRRDGRLRLRGRIAVPSASVNLQRIPGGGAAKASRDVVVVDAGVVAAAEEAMPLDTDVTLVLGERVKLRGHGLDGEVEGQLRVRERPGRAATGTGQIRIAGTYRAYGQNLTIERGRLLFAQSPLDDPGLDIRAVRKLRDVTPGLRIEGTAKAPVLTVFSTPPMEQGNALSYLVTGRPLRSLSGEDGDTVGMAARALGTATGDLLAKSIGAKLGVDDIGVAESDALGGAAFTVGKYLSPRLYLSYGVGVFHPGQVVTLRYQLTEHWELEANSGTVENRAGINYKYERD